MSTRIYIGRVSFDATQRDVERFVSGYGRIRDLVLKRGYAFIEFEDRRDAKEAVHDLDGKPLKGMR